MTGVALVVLALVVSALVAEPTTAAPRPRLRVTSPSTAASPIGSPGRDLVRPTGLRVRAATGAQTLLFVPVTWPGNPPDSITTATATSVLDQVSQWYHTISLGSLTFTPTVLDWTTIAPPAGTCGGAYDAFTGSVAQNATAALATQNITVGSYDHVIYYMPATSAAGQCSFEGLGDEPGREVWMSGFYASGYLSADGVEHELGHNLGLGHADTLTCTDASLGAVPFGPSCESVEYGNPFDVMGGGVTSMFDAPHLAALGYLSSGQLAHLSAPAQGVTSQTIDLQPLADLSSTGPRAIEVTTTEGNSYWIEYRAPVGLDGSLPSGASGLKINLVDSGSYPGTLCSADNATTCAGDTFMINPTAGSNSPDQYASLANGTSWTDPTGSVTITAGGPSDSGELVTVSVGAEPGAPSAPSVQSAWPNHVQLSWSGGIGAFGAAATGYQVLLSVDGLPFEPFQRMVVATHADFTLADWGAMTFEVVAVNAMGAGPPSVPSATIFRGVLPAPQHLAATLRGRTLRVSWQPPITDALFITQYAVTVEERGRTSSQIRRSTVAANVTTASFVIPIRHPSRLLVMVSAQGTLSSGRLATTRLNS